MKQFGTLFFYEMKKIMYRKNTWITIGILLVLFIVLMGGMSFGSTYVDGEFLETHKEGNEIDRANGLKLSGRKLDDTLFNEMKNAYDGMEKKELTYMLTEEYQTKVRPYSAIYDIVRYTPAGLNPFTITEEEFYGARERAVKESWKNYKLTEEEKEYWQEKEDKLVKPFTYQYADGYEYLISMNGVYMVCLMVSFLIAICMSCVFTEEHGRKTDQLILCSRLGRKQTYFAKILAGVIVSFLAGALFLGITIAGSFLSYGSEGGSALLQLMAPNYSYLLTDLQVFLILSGILLLACVLTGVFAMVLSEITKSNIGTMATLVAILFLARLIPIPEDLRLLSQLMNYFPINILKLDAGFMDMRLVSIFGLKLTSWQFAPLLYVLLIGIFVLIGKKVYCRYQVHGR